MRGNIPTIRIFAPGDPPEIIAVLVFHPPNYPPFSVRTHPFTDPIITTFTKYFCTKGYRTTIGRLPNTIIAYFMVSRIAARSL